jgi:hypothetical protein
MIVIPEEIDFELRRAAAAARPGAMRGIAEILGELLVQYDLPSASIGSGSQIPPTTQSSSPTAAAIH